MNSSPVGKVIGISAVSVIAELQVPSNKWSLIGGIDIVLILFLDTKMVFKKELEEPESRSVRRSRELRVVRCRVNESRSKKSRCAETDEFCDTVKVNATLSL